MLTGACHCGAVRVTIPRKPRAVTDCNCSICRRYGVLWAYYKLPTVRIETKRGTTESYAWGRKSLKFVRCKTCGCVVAWQPMKPRDRKSTRLESSHGYISYAVFSMKKER